MAHQISVKVNRAAILPKDLEVVVKSTAGGMLGRLLISKGNGRRVEAGR